MDVLPRIPALQWLSAGQLDGMTDAVFKVSYRKVARSRLSRLVAHLKIFKLFIKVMDSNPDCFLRSYMIWEVWKVE